MLILLDAKYNRQVEHTIWPFAIGVYMRKVPLKDKVRKYISSKISFYPVKQNPQLYLAEWTKIKGKRSMRQ